LPLRDGIGSSVLHIEPYPYPYEGQVDLLLPLRDGIGSSLLPYPYAYEGQVDPPLPLRDGIGSSVLNIEPYVLAYSKSIFVLAPNRQGSTALLRT